jgi:hypothetical protein
VRASHDLACSRSTSDDRVAHSYFGFGYFSATASLAKALRARPSMSMALALHQAAKLLGINVHALDQFD